jgi:Zn-dependent M28 family amino/carboxypeptidase
MMGKRLYKTYVNLTNIVVRISDGTPEGKEHAVLINSHLDSTLPSPGAADDALAVGIMLDCMRVLIETPDWSPTHAIIFCTSPIFSALLRIETYSVQKCSTTPRNPCKTDLIYSPLNIPLHQRSYLFNSSLIFI